MSGLYSAAIFDLSNHPQKLWRRDAPDYFAAEPWENIVFQFAQNVLLVDIGPNGGLSVKPFSGNGLERVLNLVSALPVIIFAHNARVDALGD